MFAHQSLSLEQALRRKMLPELSTFACPYDTGSGRSGVIRIVFPEFTCLCPRTGYPDFASIYLYYLPTKRCLELKSWKLYLNAFRMIGTFHETVTAHLFSTLSALLKPRWICVAGQFFPRGNVDTTVVFESRGPRPVGADLLMADLRPRCRSFDREPGLRGNSQRAGRRPLNPA
jgi:7-cyano-7-deazaguanine reductase